MARSRLCVSNSLHKRQWFLLSPQKDQCSKRLFVLFQPCVAVIHSIQKHFKKVCGYIASQL